MSETNQDMKFPGHVKVDQKVFDYVLGPKAKWK